MSISRKIRLELIMLRVLLVVVTIENVLWVIKEFVL